MVPGLRSARRCSATPGQKARAIVHQDHVETDDRCAPVPSRSRNEDAQHSRHVVVGDKDGAGGGSEPGALPAEPEARRLLDDTTTRRCLGRHRRARVDGHDTETSFTQPVDQPVIRGALASHGDDDRRSGPAGRRRVAVRCGRRRGRDGFLLGCSIRDAQESAVSSLGVLVVVALKCGVGVHAPPDRSVDVAVLTHDPRARARVASNAHSGPVQVAAAPPNLATLCGSRAVKVAVYSPCRVGGVPCRARSSRSHSPSFASPLPCWERPRRRRPGPSSRGLKMRECSTREPRSRPRWSGSWPRSCMRSCSGSTCDGASSSRGKTGTGPRPTWTGSPQTIHTAAGDGLKVIVTLGDTPLWASDQTLWRYAPTSYKPGVYRAFYPPGPGHLVDFQKLATKLASTFGNDVLGYECRNEPNALVFDVPSAYVVGRRVRRASLRGHADGLLKGRTRRQPECSGHRRLDGAVGHQQ